MDPTLLMVLMMGRAHAETPDDPAASCQPAAAASSEEKLWACGDTTVRLREAPTASRAAMDGVARTSALDQVGRVFRTSKGTFTVEGQDMAFELYTREQGAPLTVFNVSGEPTPGTARLVTCVVPQKGPAAVDQCSYLSTLAIRDGRF